MKSIITTIFCLLIIVSCKRKENSGIDFSDEYLSSHEWVIDSVYGSDEFIQDWIYFTPEKQFYRFSKYSKSYVIDSALNWKHNKVLKDDSEMFKIIALDSENIELKTPLKTYHAERWNKFDPEDIELFISNNRYKLLINGKWKLDSTEIGKGGLPLSCDQIEKGSVFNFKDNGLLTVLEKDSVNFCNEFSYSLFKEELSLRKSDMVMGLPIAELNENKLVLVSRYIPKNNYTEEMWKLKRKGFKLYLTKLAE
jgi:hypothetical protein